MLLLPLFSSTRHWRKNDHLVVFFESRLQISWSPVNEDDSLCVERYPKELDQAPCPITLGEIYRKGSFLGSTILSQGSIELDFDSHSGFGPLSRK